MKQQKYLVPYFWKQRGEEILQLNRNQRLKLKLLANPTLAELVRAVKQKKISQL
ncbi:hypothetical protein [Dulcicalothrix desertica]|uniref:hypothetical protein n=1 Tax=Dulcicalothrix desertica TaxID=32056 RepID=UPI00119B2C45|nr:hypothetical protein [Dulcicalothrix desertica]TWH50883.1 hypothetical protein CAL7102_05230 [Dulcicalothrix desertica PCC 7102]